MQKKLTTLLGMALAVTCAFAQTELFKPYKQTALRLPAVPIVVNDPYFSIWSPFVEFTFVYNICKFTLCVMYYCKIRKVYGY